MNYSDRRPAQSTQIDSSQFEAPLDSEQAAALLKIHPETQQRMARNRQINGVQIGRLWRFRASQLNDWMQSKMVG